MKGAVSLAEETRQEVDNLDDKPDSLGERSAFDPATSVRSSASSLDDLFTKLREHWQLARQ